MLGNIKPQKNPILREVKKINFINHEFAAVFLALLFIITNSFAGAGDEDEASAYVSFIETIVQTTQGLNTHGVLCVLGSDEISKIIAASVKSVINLNSDPSKYTSCKAIYIAKDKNKNVRTYIEQFNSKKILTIATFDGFTEGGGLLQIETGRRNFELTLNTEVAKKTGIKLNALALSLVIN